MKKLWLLFIFAAALSPMLRAEPCGAYYYITPGPDQDAQPVLYLPNSWPRDIKVELLGTKPPVKWWGLACDEVWLPVGSEFRAISEGANSAWLYTLKEDGTLDYRYDPVP